MELCISFHSNRKIQQNRPFPHQPFCSDVSCSSMDRRKPSRGRSMDDELAMVKAAAWAWYQRGSGSEGRVMREYDLAMPNRTYKPSRYKIEARKESEEAPPKQISPPLSAPLSRLSSFNSTQSEILDDCEIEISPPPSAPPSRLSSFNSTQSEILYDCEIEGISKELDRYIMSSRAKYLRSFLLSDYRARNKVASFPLSGTSEKRSKPKNKDSSGFWLKYTTVCSLRRDDVVVGRSLNVARIHGGRKVR